MRASITLGWGAFVVAAVACGDGNAGRAGHGGADGVPPAPEGGPIGVAPRDGGFSDGGGLLADSDVCSEQVQAAQPVPVDLLLLVDASSSMLEVAPGGRTKQALVRDALVAFVRDPRSAGLGVGLQYFPLSSETECASDADCGPFNSGAGKPEWWGCHTPMVCSPPRAPLGTAFNVCGPASAQEDCFLRQTSCVPVGYCSVTGWPCTSLAEVCETGRAGDTCTRWPRVCNGAPICNPAMFRELAVPIADLPSAADALEAELVAREPSGSTPMGPAIEASLAHLAERGTSHPDRTAALVLATDGLPQGCGPADAVDTIAARLSAAAAARPALTTYVIGVIDPNDPNSGAKQALEQLARAGASGMPFVLSPTADLTQTFLAALEQIRGRALPCEFTIPIKDVPALDFGRVNLRFRGAGGERDIFYVGKADRCDPMIGGWYYDVDPTTGATPTRVITCPATCAGFKTDREGRIDLRFGCKTLVPR